MLVPCCMDCLRRNLRDSENSTDPRSVGSLISSLQAPTVEHIANAATFQCVRMEIRFDISLPFSKR